MAVSHPNPHLARLEIALPAQFMLISNSPGPDFQHLNLRCSVHGTAWQKKNFETFRTEATESASGKSAYVPQVMGPPLQSLTHQPQLRMPRSVKLTLPDKELQTSTLYRIL